MDGAYCIRNWNCGSVFLYARDFCDNLGWLHRQPLFLVNYYSIRIAFFLTLSFLCVTTANSLSASSPIIKLSEIKPGMKGVWHTVITGTNVEEFPLEVIGISQNFAGPQRAVIICQALDPTNLLSGPVAGMSGSPVYIEGKLAGAYAYGYLWPKEQAIIGVTPIEDMLELLTKESEPRAQSVPQVTSTAAPFNPYPHAVATAEVAPEVALAPLPSPMLAAGFSASTIQAFSTEWQKFGITLMQAPAGGGQKDTPIELVPGAAVAGVLATGDFTIAGTGTITWRDDDQLLAFGHPFFQGGPVEIPMAGAEILTVVRGVPRSFKLSNPGPIVGTIYQDRLTAIAGRVGPVPQMTQFQAITRTADGLERSVNASIFRHPQLGPLLTGMGLLETLSSTLEFEHNQTIRLSVTVSGKGYEPIEVYRVASGPDAPLRLAIDFFQNYQELTNNPYNESPADSVLFEIETTPEVNRSVLRSVSLGNTRIQSGAVVPVTISLENHLKQPQTFRVDVPIPSGLKAGDELTLLVGDAASADKADGLNDIRSNSLKSIAERWAKTRSNDSLYIKLLKSKPGLRVAGESLPGLPPSVRAQMTTDTSAFVRQPLDELTLWESYIPLGGEFSSFHRVKLTVE